MARRKKKLKQLEKNEMKKIISLSIEENLIKKGKEIATLQGAKK